MYCLKRFHYQGFTDSSVVCVSCRSEKVPTTIGATGSLSRTLAQYLDDVSSENYRRELQKMANLGTACLFEEDNNNEAHESVSVFSMNLYKVVAPDTFWK
jgi:hypothetical protein